MNQKLSRISLGAVFIVAVVLAKVLLPPQQSSADDAPHVTPDSIDAKADRANQLFELRIYTAAPGKMEALQQRFRDHTLRLFQKHGIKSVGYWIGADEKEKDRLYYIVAYPDRASRDKMLMNGIAVDPEFRQAVVDSEKEGKLTTKIESVLLTSTDYSPLK